MAVFAEPTDVETAYGGSLPSSPEGRVEYLLDTVSARLSKLLPSLVERIADDPDLAMLAKDAVVQAVIRRLPAIGGPQVASETQGAGPWTHTVRYTQDRSRTFSDEDLALLRDQPAGLSMGTIGLGLVDWSAQ